LECSAFKFVSSPAIRFRGRMCSLPHFHLAPTDLFHLAFPKDPLRNKILVYTVFILELTQTIIITDSAFNVFAIGYGDFRYYNNIDIAWFSVPIITGLGAVFVPLHPQSFVFIRSPPCGFIRTVAFVAEGFYAYRISVLARSYWVAGLILFVSIFSSSTDGLVCDVHSISKLAFVQLGGAIASAIVLKHAHQFTHLLGKDYSIAAGVSLAVDRLPGLF